MLLLLIWQGVNGLKLFEMDDKTCSNDDIRAISRYSGEILQMVQAARHYTSDRRFYNSAPVGMPLETYWPQNLRQMPEIDGMAQFALFVILPKS